MAIDFDTIETVMAVAISSGIAGGINDQLASQQVPTTALAAVYNWSGILVEDPPSVFTTTVLTSDTSEVVVGDYIWLDVHGQWYEITAIDPNVSVTARDVYGVGSAPLGHTQSSKAALPPAPPIDESTGDSFADPIASAVRAALETVADDTEISGVTAGVNVIGPGVIS